MSDKIYWKVIRKETRASAMVNQLPTLCVIYHANKRVFPSLPTSKLMVFSTRQAARSFKRRLFTPSSFKIVRCYADVCEKQDYTIVDYANRDFKRVIDTFSVVSESWESVCKDFHYDRLPVPTDTVFVNWVYCLE